MSSFVDTIAKVADGVRALVALAIAANELRKALHAGDEEEAARVVRERVREQAAGRARKRTEAKRAEACECEKGRAEGSRWLPYVLPDEDGLYRAGCAHCGKSWKPATSLENAVSHWRANRVS